MTLQQLKAFLAVVDGGSFRGAARHLDISQAGLTSSLKSLEAVLGVRLLNRSVQGVSLTPAGQNLLPRARLIVRETHRAQDEALQSRSAGAETLAVGLGPTPTAVLLPLVVPQLHRRFPQVQLRLFSGFHEQLLPELQQSRIELAVTAVPQEGVGPGFVSRRLFRSALVVVARKGHPLEGARTLQALHGCEWLLLGPPGRPGGTVLRFHAEQGLPTPRVAAVCESFSHLSPLLAATDWLALVPAAMVSQRLLGEAVVALEIQQVPPAFDNCLVYRSDTVLTTVAQTFAGMCQSFSRIIARGATDTLIRAGARAD